MRSYLAKLPRGTLPIWRGKMIEVDEELGIYHQGNPDNYLYRPKTLDGVHISFLKVV
jgi:hypothetical protein